MKTIGIIGGLGPESTVDYYKEIISAFNTRYQELAYPEIIIYSANMNELMKFVESKSWHQLAEWLLKKISYLYHAGAEFAAIASNTPHIVFDEVKK
jgi:aspartate racemase